MLLDAGTLSNAKWEANCSDIVFAYFATQDPGMMRPFLEFDEANPDRDSYRYFVCHCVLLLTGWGMTPPPDADIMGLAVAALLKCVGGETPPAITAQTREIETEMAICVAIAIQYGFVDPLSPIAHRLAKLMDLPEPSTYAKRKGISAFYIKYHTDYLVALLHATMIRLVSTIYLV